MMNKLKVSALEAYCNIYARKTADDFFSKQALITGNQILTYTNMSQVNLFILHHLFAAWREETARMQSPYFDYHTIEVQEALKQFMNTVSRHIAVRRAHFEPLVNRASVSTLTLLLTPYYFIEELLRNNSTGKVNIQQFKETGRYIQIHKPFFQSLTDTMESRYPAEIPVHEAIRLLDEVYAQFQHQLEPADAYIHSLSQVLPLDKNDLLADTSKPTATQPVEYKPLSVQEPAVVLPEKKVPVQQEIPVEEKITPLREQPILPLVNEQIDMEQFVKAAQTPSNPVKPAPAEPVVHPAEPVKKVSPAPVNLNEKFLKEQPTLNDRLKQGTRTHNTLLDKHQKTKVNDLKSALSLNQRFLFINALFKGDNTAFNEALQDLEKCPDHQSAMELVQTKLFATYKWDPTHEEVINFLDIIERKFY